MRIYLYILAGVISALIGWNLGQFILTDLGLLQSVPEIALFPCIAISLAIGMVMNEIFISNPTRLKLNFRIARIPFLIALGLGLLVGLAVGSISQILFLPQVPVPAFIVRTLGWVFIGSSVGLAEGLTWRWRSLEAGDRKRFWRRFKTSLIASILASLAAAVIFESLRLLLDRIPGAFKAAEDPVGFSLLGLLLGLVFSLTNSPSYMVALRAGAGFEYTDPGPSFEDFPASPSTDRQMSPRIARDLQFVSDGKLKEIEEGLSIQLPATGSITIGSNPESNIYIPGIPPNVADLELQHRETILAPNPQWSHTIKVNGETLKNGQQIALKHNYVLTFRSIEQDDLDEQKIYRFVYYNRFLDPQA